MSLGRKPRAPPLSSTSTSKSWLLLVCLVWVVASVVCVQVSTAADVPVNASLETRSENKLQKAEDELISEDDFTDEIDDGKVDTRYAGDEDGDDLLEEDLLEIREAKNNIEKYMQEKFPLNRSPAVYVPPGPPPTPVNLGDVYYIESHDLYGLARYPNKSYRRWWFIKGPNVRTIIVWCPFFKIEWSRRCKKDKFAIFKGPSYRRGVRRCGQIHGFWKQYDDPSIKIVFKTNYVKRRAGFECIILPTAYPPTTESSTSSTTTASTTTSTSSTTTSTTTFSPGCPHEPVANPSPIPVLSCSDISPQSICSCTDLDPSVICLDCLITTVCDMQFFADHDFSAVFIALMLDCEGTYPVQVDSYTFGYEHHVISHTTCLTGGPVGCDLPKYNFTTKQFLFGCPFSFDLCTYPDPFRQAVDRNLVKGQSMLNWNKETSRQSMLNWNKETSREIDFCGSDPLTKFIYLESPVDVNFTSPMDFSDCTHLEELVMTVYDVAPHIHLNSPVIKAISITLVNVPDEPSDDLIENIADTPEGYPVITWKIENEITA